MAGTFIRTDDRRRVRGGMVGGVPGMQPYPGGMSTMPPQRHTMDLEVSAHICNVEIDSLANPSIWDWVGAIMVESF